ncbi:hypothetical protein [Pseudomonas sp. ME-P-057]|jgi:hypothetical protein|uniref:hypothetical protein n=1 Tax=Pseudomonas sp. ME-P-057 TaxID=3040321 RepID=UPI0025542CB4|nr:hypothetical protein [Pseudomonas sp. ME-P-057]
MKNTTQLLDDSAASGDWIMLRFIIPLVRLLATHVSAVAFFMPAQGNYRESRDTAECRKFPLDA